MSFFPRITGWGKYLPEKVLTNRELESLVDTTDEWIFTRTGIRERRIAAKTEGASSMGTKAAKHALRVAGLSPSELDLIIVATSTGEQVFPACASLIQHELGAEKAGAFDVNAACSGFVYALATAYQFGLGGFYRNILVVGSEVYSRILDWKDRSTCVLFGDGAGAVVVQGFKGKARPLGFSFGSDGSKANMLYVPGICAPPVNQNHPEHYLAMEGKEVFKAAVTLMVKSANEAITSAGLSLSDMDLFIPHQANRRIIDSAAKYMGLPPEKVYVNVQKYGNTSSASIPIAICEAVEEERLKPQDKVVMVGFGGGFTWGAISFEWNPS